LGGVLSRWRAGGETSEPSTDRAVLHGAIQRLSALRTSVFAQIAIGASTSAMDDGHLALARVAPLGTREEK
jgi:hypothetical protein